MPPGAEAEREALAPLARLRSWLAGQQLAFGALLLRFLEETGPPAKREFQAAVFRDRLAPDEGLPHPVPYQVTLQQLPPPALAALCELPERAIPFWYHHRPNWEWAFKNISWQDNKSLIAGARLVAHCLGGGLHSPHMIARLAQAELRVTRRADRWTDHQDSLERLMRALQASPVGLGAIAAIAAMRESRLPGRWAMVENALLQRAYAWPLFVVPQAQDFAFALPVAIDVHYWTYGDPENSIAIEGEGSIAIGEEVRGFIDDSVLAAKRLWLKTFATRDLHVKRQLRRASVRFDFSAAAAVLKPFAALLPVGIRLEQSSLQSLLALEVYSRFIGSPGLKTVSATGGLGGRIPNGSQWNGEDRWILAPNDHEFRRLTLSKIRWVKRKHTIDRIIVPSGTAEKGFDEHLEVVPGARLEEYAQLAFGQEARRHRFIRAPDLAARFGTIDKEPWRVAEDERAEIQQAFDALRYSDVPILRLSNVRATSVAQALYRLNKMMANDPDRITYDHAAGRWLQEEGERIGHFAFVRSYENELPDRFWQLVWPVLGADQESFRNFAFTVSKEVPARILAERLNDMTPQSPERVLPPDVLVIIAPIRTELPEFATGPAGRLRLHSLEHQIWSRWQEDSDYLRPSSNRCVAHYLGRLRVIVVEEAADSYFRTLAPEDLGDADLAAAAAKLSVFRHGFTSDAALTILGGEPEPCRAMLRTLQEVDFGDSRLLEFASGIGEYFLSRRAALPNKAHERAKRHADAATALAGFLEQSAGDSASRFDFAAVLDPGRRHEIQWQLGRAVHAAGDDLSTDSRKRFTQIQERVGRLGEQFTWSQLRWITNSNEAGAEAWETLLDLLHARSRFLFHPEELVRAARFGERQWRKLKRDNKQVEAKEIWYFVTWLMQQAEEMCGQIDRTERLAAEFMVRTSRSCLALNSGEKLYSVKEDIERSLKLSDYAVVVVHPEWFSYAGDYCFDDNVAAAVYRQGFCNDGIMGTRNEVPCFDTLVKYVGACLRRGNVPDGTLVEQAIGSLSLRRMVKEQTNGATRTGIRSTHSWDRWERGFNALRPMLQATLTGASGPAC
ncbi:hypothetical protein [Elioraea sp.]|uniref:hypothetical protein n=1 Tax=Elioraea sp. TaxID=2185103 RepID=UPI0025BFBA27|nr:hypothetical protein [Elioraea sp.]